MKSEKNIYKAQFLMPKINRFWNRIFTDKTI